jgi:hypothetical protein
MYSNGRSSKPPPVQWKPSDTLPARAGGMGAGRSSPAG